MLAVPVAVILLCVVLIVVVLRSSTLTGSARQLAVAGFALGIAGMGLVIIGSLLA